MPRPVNAKPQSSLPSTVMAGVEAFAQYSGCHRTTSCLTFKMTGEWQGAAAYALSSAVRGICLILCTRIQVLKMPTLPANLQPAKFEAHSTPWPLFSFFFQLKGTTLNPKWLWALLQADYQRRSIPTPLFEEKKKCAAERSLPSHVNAELHATHNVAELFTPPHKH